MRGSTQALLLAELAQADRHIAKIERLITIATECGFSDLIEPQRGDLAGLRDWRNIVARILPKEASPQ